MIDRLGAGIGIAQTREDAERLSGPPLVRRGAPPGS
jgi:hypothetical protein